MASSSGIGSPCGACKFLRRKCTRDCIFAPYFNCEQGPARFAAIHKVFGASNVSKLLSHVPVPERCEAVVTIAYEAQARIRDPVYGCVSHIFALQHQVALLQAQLMQMKAQLAQNTVMAASRTSSENHHHHHHHHWQGINSGDHDHHPEGLVLPNYTYACMQSMSPQSSLDSCSADQGLIPTSITTQLCAKRRAAMDELGELQALALRMMKS
ncbi:hypothetical protein J5N97_028725 [Dioscorea zingiberensis]|uniref:LOB domain-containing protein n=1 Tax=Dioscorea zingiberensis TaxID=325984 RepID=A0A9D5H547_9LILI|nr:hypothetical protein J5N97_028725 [Dioscorea zingiberensis]